MKAAVEIRWAVVALAVVGLCVPQLTLGATPTKTISDVQLHDGVLIGQVVTPDNQPVVGTTVSLVSGERQIDQRTTNEKGVFAFAGLQQNGVYQVVAKEGQGVYRAWNKNIAPPAAQPGALIVANTDTVRGQAAMMGFRNLMANPIVVAGIVATAVAVPVAIHNANKSSSSP